LFCVGHEEENSISSPAAAATVLEEPVINVCSLLFDPPVDSCELKPYVSVSELNGNIYALNESANDQRVAFTWYRGAKRVCVNSSSSSSCINTATMQCLTCVKLSLSNVYFCSEKCLIQAWPQHKLLHNNKYSAHNTSNNNSKQWHYEDNNPSSIYSKFPSELVNDWEIISHDRSYIPSLDDVGRSLRLECWPVIKKAVPPNLSNNHTAEAAVLGKMQSIETSAVIAAPQPPPQRSLIYTEPIMNNTNNSAFKVLCYNVLAQIYATRHIYPYTPLWALQWDYRKNRILAEILRHQADIICLQEVQANHFEQFFSPQLNSSGYDGIFKRKTRESMSEDAAAIDGCATFYRRDKFALNEQYGIEYNEAARQQTSDRKALRRLMKGNIALVLVLEELQTAGNSSSRRQRKRRLCVANTHIYWDPDFADVKLWQSFILCNELEKLVLHRNLPLILCGDFNSLVNSSVYELLSTEHVQAGEDVFGSVANPAGILPPSHQLAHHLNLSSTYSSLGEPKYTNYTGHFIGVLDYIFYTRALLRCVACLDVDEESLLQKQTALPNPQYSSDHLPLVTIMEFTE
jgi:CCR4-NOT transcription complex subunit 6